MRALLSELRRCGFLLAGFVALLIDLARVAMGRKIDPPAWVTEAIRLSTPPDDHDAEASIGDAFDVGRPWGTATMGQA